MRESLSETRSPVRAGGRAAGYAMWGAVALSLAVGVAAAVDQAGGQELAAYTKDMYAAYDKEASPGLLYGLLYTVAVLGALLWLPAAFAAWARGRWTPVLAIAALVVTGGLAASVLAAAEYGQTLFPPMWGRLSLLGPLAGLAGTVLFFVRGRR